jgi:hypothetical protein
VRPLDPAARALLVLALFSLGCAPQVGYGRAATLRPGQFRIGMSLVPSFESAKLRPEAPATGPWARFVLGAHAGVSERFEIGGRLWYFNVPTLGSEIGGALDTKMLLRRPPGGKGTSVSVALSATYYQPRMPGAPWHVIGGTVPLFIGIDLGRHQLVLGPRVSVYGVTAYGMESIVHPGFGASIGFFGRVKETFDISPELVLMWSPIPFGGEGSPSESRVGASSLQLGLGGSWELGEPRETKN